MTKVATLKLSMQESIGEHFARIRANGPRKPLRTITELADELGTTARTLVTTFRHHDGPKPMYKTHRSTGPMSTWYDPDEVRAWWRAHNKDKT